MSKHSLIHSSGFKIAKGQSDIFLGLMKARLAHFEFHKAKIEHGKS